MKKSTLLALLLAVAMSPVLVHAQAPRPSGTVAILDLTYIFKHHKRFNELTAAMRQDVERAEQALNVDRGAMEKLAEPLKGDNAVYKRGSAEYKQLEDELIKRQTELQTKVTLQRRQFLEQEAKIYYTVYQEVLDHVKTYSEQNGVSLVLRFNGDPIDRNDPQEVLKELNKSVIYSHRSIDITPVILERLGSNIGPPVPGNPTSLPGIIQPGPAQLPRNPAGVPGGSPFRQ